MNERRKLHRSGGFGALAIAAMLMTTDATLGQNGPRPGEDPSERQALLERFDADGDGKLSQEERGALREHMQQEGERADRRGRRGDRGGERGGFGGRGGMGGNPMGMVARSMFRPLFMTRDLPVMIEMLDLEEAQQEIVSVVLEDYDAAFRMASEETRDAVNSMNQTLRDDASTQERFEALRAEMETIRQEMRAAREQMRGENAQERSEEETQAMRDSFRARMEEMRSSFRQELESRMESPEVQDSWAEQRAIYARFDALRRSMNSETEDAIVTILVEEQINRWDDVMRRIRRDRMLPEGRISGESFNVERFSRDSVSDLDEAAQARATEIMSAWMVDLDEALLRRDAHDATARMKAMELLATRDSEALERLVLDRLQFQRAVREVNDEAVDAMAATMPEEAGLEFRREAFREAYGRWLRSARSSRAIEAALQLEGLEEDLRAAIVELQTDCNAEMTDQNERVLAAVRQWEEPRELRYIRGMSNGDWRGQEREDTPLDEATRRRSEVDQEYIEALKDLLGEERAESLPGMRGRGEWDRRGGDRSEGDREAMRQQFMERFDANGDGEIDEQEREAIREAFRNNRGRRGGEGGGADRPQRGDNPRRGGGEPV